MSSILTTCIVAFLFASVNASGTKHSSSQPHIPKSFNLEIFAATIKDEEATKSDNFDSSNMAEANTSTAMSNTADATASSSSSSSKPSKSHSENATTHILTPIQTPPHLHPLNNLQQLVHNAPSLTQISNPASPAKASCTVHEIAKKPTRNSTKKSVRCWRRSILRVVRRVIDGVWRIGL